MPLFLLLQGPWLAVSYASPHVHSLAAVHMRLPLQNECTMRDKLQQRVNNEAVRPVATAAG